MNCSDLMKSDVACCAASASIVEVAQCMRDRHIGFVPVCDSHGMVVGTLTDRDLAIRVLAEQLPLESTTAGEVMTQGIVYCKPHDSLYAAEQLMSKHKVSRIVCVDETMRPVGVISLSDVATTETGGKSSAILRSIAQREARA